MFTIDRELTSNQ